MLVSLSRMDIVRHHSNWSYVFSYKVYIHMNHLDHMSTKNLTDRDYFDNVYRIGLSAKPMLAVF